MAIWTSVTAVHGGDWQRDAWQFRLTLQTIVWQGVSQPVLTGQVESMQKNSKLMWLLDAHEVNQ